MSTSTRLPLTLPFLSSYVVKISSCQLAAKQAGKTSLLSQRPPPTSYMYLVKSPRAHTFVVLLLAAILTTAKTTKHYTMYQMQTTDVYRCRVKKAWLVKDGGFVRVEGGAGI